MTWTGRRLALLAAVYARSDTAVAVGIPPWLSITVDAAFLPLLAGAGAAAVARQNRTNRVFRYCC